MNEGPPLARVASLIGDPTRALMLAALMDGRSRTAGELARAADITAPTASAHLGKLIDAGLLSMTRQGRHRYHRLASASVAQALEALMVVSASPVAARPLGPADKALRRARSCYDHLAGTLAVDLAGMMVAQGHIAVDDQHWSLTAGGMQWLMRHGIELETGPGAGRRCLVRPCLDWSERRPHIGGQLGKALLDLCLREGWVRRRTDSRALNVTAAGEAAIRALAGAKR